MKIKDAFKKSIHTNTESVATEIYNKNRPSFINDGEHLSRRIEASSSALKEDANETINNASRNAEKIIYLSAELANDTSEKIQTSFIAKILAVVSVGAVAYVAKLNYPGITSPEFDISKILASIWGGTTILAIISWIFAKFSPGNSYLTTYFSWLKNIAFCISFLIITILIIKLTKFVF